MKDTTRRTRLDLYEQIADIRNRFQKLYQKYGTDTAIGFRAFYNYIELDGISRVEQYMTIKGLNVVIGVNKSMLEEMEEAK